MKKILTLSLLLIFLKGIGQTKTIEVTGKYKTVFKADTYVGNLSISSNDETMKSDEMNQRILEIVNFLNVKNEISNIEELNKDCSEGLYKNFNLKVSAQRKNEIQAQLSKVKDSNPNLMIDFDIVEKSVSEDFLNTKETEMFKHAVGNAEQKAKILAAAIQLKTGKMLKIQDPNYWPYENGNSGTNSEDVDYEQSVTVTFELIE